MKQFKGRIIVPVSPAGADSNAATGSDKTGAAGATASIQAEALVSRGGFNTLASFQKALMFGDKTAACSDQNNRDLYGKPMAGKALCLPQTIGSTTGGMVLFCAAAMERQPACLLFSKPIDSLAAAGAILAGVWTEHPMPTVDSLGDEFLEAVKTGDRITVAGDGTVTVE
jgi:predicted aconitase with swiveling domain